jgi:hypothetical protein
VLGTIAEVLLLLRRVDPGEPDLVRVAVSVEDRDCIANVTIMGLSSPGRWYWLITGCVSALMVSMVKL